MQCPYCKNNVNPSKKCRYCGMDIKNYSLAVLISYKMYNEALEKAKLRNIGEAINTLREALKINKKFYEARNLLGLCYFEIGEVGLALKEWVISSNIKRNDNKAISYIERIENNKSLTAISNTVRKYNLALRDCYDNNDDVAIIQLKKVVSSSNIKILKAYQLLGLLYIKNKDYRKAKEILEKALLIDSFNYITHSYLSEVNEHLSIKSRSPRPEKKLKEEKNTKVNKPEEQEFFSHVNYKETNTVVSVINLIVGIVIGALVIWFLIIPAKEQEIGQRFENRIKSLNEDIAKRDNDITVLKENIDDLKNDANNTKVGSISKDERIKLDNNLISAYVEIGNNNLDKAKELLSGIEKKNLNKNEKILYYNITRDVYKEEIPKLINLSREEIRKGNYNNAIAKLGELLDIDPDNEEGQYYLAKAYVSKDEKEEARKLFKKYLDNYPNGKFSRDSNNEIVKIDNSLNMEDN